MSRVDYEAAWVELGELIASREGWGAKVLAQEMAKVAAAHRVGESFLERGLRIYGGELKLVAQPTEQSSSGPGGKPTVSAAGSRPIEDRGGHDGEQHAEHAAVG